MSIPLGQLVSSEASRQSGIPSQTRFKSRHALSAKQVNSSGPHSSILAVVPVVVVTVVAAPAW